MKSPLTISFIQWTQEYSNHRATWIKNKNQSINKESESFPLGFNEPYYEVYSSLVIKRQNYMRDFFRMSFTTLDDEGPTWLLVQLDLLFLSEKELCLLFNLQ